ncbi:hypothetical protein ACFX1Z_024974 [Malus domestica]
MNPKKSIWKSRYSCKPWGTFSQSPYLAIPQLTSAAGVSLVNKQTTSASSEKTLKLWNLDRSLQELTALKNDVVRSVQVAELQTSMKRLDKVQLWIKKAKTIET